MLLPELALNSGSKGGFGSSEDGDERTVEVRGDEKEERECEDTQEGK